MFSSRSPGSGAVLPVVVFSALIAIVAAFSLTSWLGSSGESSADAQRSMAASSAMQKDTSKPETSTEAIVTGAVTKERPRYLDAAWTPLHFKPGIDKASNEQCLLCHQEILKRQVRKTSPAGVDGNATLAWYQTLDTYAGDQETFHARHLTTPLAKKVMNLKCNFCHQGHDPRDEAPGSSATTTKTVLGNFTLRKQVNPSNSCLLCHGAFPVTNMGLEGSWSELREGFESEDAPNGCLVCHAEQFRTVRHQVDYLNAGAIEKLAQNSTSDLCFGCHGGRKWYRNSYPYPRHPWPGMDAEVPKWAKGRAAESAPEHRLKK